MSMTNATCALLACALHWSDVVIGKFSCEYCMVHMSVRCAAGDVEKVEFHCLAVWRQPACHPRPVLPAVAIMRKDQAIAIDVEHRDWIVVTTGRVIGSPFRHHLVHERGAAGSDAQRPRTGACIPGCGPIAAWPFQFPARVLIRANASSADACCASGFWPSGLCVSDYGKPIVETHGIRRIARHLATACA